MVFKSELTFDDLLRAGLKVPLKDKPRVKSSSQDGDEEPQEEDQEEGEG